MSDPTPHLPRLLVLDDVLGREVAGGANADRALFCANYLVKDVTPGAAATSTVAAPHAEAVFCRAQRPAAAGVGDRVENDLEGAMRLVASGWDDAPIPTPRWALVLLDLQFKTGTVTERSHSLGRGLPEGRPEDLSHYFGLTLLETINARYPDLPVVMLSSQPRQSASRRFTDLGAADFLPSTCTSKDLADKIRLHGLYPDPTGTIVGRGPRLLKSLRAARRASLRARGEYRHVLILGERGTGKELMAAFLHAGAPAPPTGPRPYVTLNSAAFSQTLWQSKLFGHMRGAFTGAATQRGAILAADGGDLFLDEVGHMPDEVQGGLLRALEQGEIEVQGESGPRRIDVRFLSATNLLDLEGKAAAERFRSDLLDRLRGATTITLAPLRERREDIPALVERFIRADERKLEPPALTRQITPEAMEVLVQNDWPGNIRQLRQCLQKAVADYPGLDYLIPRHLDLPGQTRPTQAPGVSLPPAPHQPRDPDAWIESLSTFCPPPLTRDDLGGKLAVLDRACGNLILSFLGAALRATMLPGSPREEGSPPKVDPLEAIRLIHGDPSLDANTARTRVISLLTNGVTRELPPVLVERMRSDPVLSQLWHYLYSRLGAAEKRRWGLDAVDGTAVEHGPRPARARRRPARGSAGS